MQMRIFGTTVDVDAKRVVAKMDTRRIVARTLTNEGKNGKLIFLAGVSKDKTGKRKVFVRTGLFDGLRLSIGKIRKQAGR